MKKIIYFILAATLLLAGCQTKEEKTGNIYGSVTDKATGEPIKSAAVELQPGGTKHHTGNDGYFEITDLKVGDYTLNVTKTGYTDVLNYKVKVESGKTTRVDVPIEKLPAALRIVNDNQQDINELDFGSALSDVTRSFSIFNDSPEPLEWEITKTATWISNISKTSGTLKAGATQSVVITIDRDKLTSGDNTTTIQITSDNGSKQLTVKATGEVKILPTLNTLKTEEITTTSATLKGEILTEGTPTYTERGFVYSLSPMPTLETTIAKITAPVTSTQIYSYTITGLTMDKTYYVRAYAVNKAGTAYSTNETNFKTERKLANVTTQDVTNKNIAMGTATFTGNIVSIGDPGYTERGFVYGLSKNPTIESDTKKSVSGSGTGEFSYNATGLTVGKIYYVRAYAINTLGTAYGAEKVCDFSAMMPEVTTQDVTNKKISAGTAIFNGTIVKIGDPAYTERGFVFGLNKNPTIEYDTKKTVAGSVQTGAYSYSATDLTMGKIYYVRAYATSVHGTTYGAEKTCDFNAVMPTVTTTVATNVDATKATLNGNITSVGDPAYSKRGFVYGTNNNPTIGNGTNKEIDGIGTGSFNVEITELSAGTTYYFCAYAINSADTKYGTVLSFKAENPQYVILETAKLMVQKTDIGQGNWSSMNSLCNNSTLAGLTGWRLPTKNELAVLYNERNTIGGFVTSGSSTTGYWSSTEYDYYHWMQFFNNGEQNWKGNSSNFNARCVRTYP